jgi:sialate O-acetylesterase
MLTLLLAGLLQPELELPSVFSDHMVLQRGKPVPFFGTAGPGERIRVTIGSRFVETTAKPDGSWSAQFRPLEAGGPYRVTVQGRRTLTFEDVLVGEVWLASGQSNMEWAQVECDDFEVAREETDARVRMFTVDKVSSESPGRDARGRWIVSHPDTIHAFSGVANAFAKVIQRELGVPVGIVHASWGGTPAESWTRRSALRADPVLAPIVEQYLDGLNGFDERKAEYDRAIATWNSKVVRVDPGNRGVLEGFADFHFDDSRWKQVKLPNLLEVTEEGEMDGAVWYRRVVHLPDDWYGQPLTVHLGPIDDFDSAYFNGHKVGRTDGRTRWWYAVPRRYRIAPGLTRRGPNVLAVRVFDQTGRGGFTGSPLQMRLQRQDGQGEPIPLAGDWSSKVEIRFAPPSDELLRSQPRPPFGPGHAWAPGGLYNGMIAPLVPYAIRGVLWYQGESNVSRAEEYRTLFPTLIRDWRAAWRDSELPFLFVQLANFMERVPQPGESEWAMLREAQSTALSLPHTGMAVALDIGEANDIHPRNKREVGRRLALHALAEAYDRPVAANGPTFQEAKVERETVRIRFRHAAGLRTRDGGPPSGFAVAGPDRRFVWADARLEGETVILTAPQGGEARYVRYAWANNPDVNLVNGAGLPAAPFRTDR